MNEWLLLALFLVIGVGMLVAGITYMQREKDDPESVKIYTAVSAIGALLTIAAVAWRVLG